MYDKHELLNKESIVHYIRYKLDYFEDELLQVSEIGDGNINYVYRIVGETSGKSIIVKQADKYLRASGRPLDTHRNKIEAKILSIEDSLVPGYVPKIYGYDEVMCTLIMEDISDYHNLRHTLHEHKIYPLFAREIACFLSNTLFLTTDLVLARAKKKEYARDFCNIELCDISEDLVLCEPYDNYKQRNIITKGMERFVEDELYHDDTLKAQVAMLRNSYMNHAQSLLHGDLHTGSIFINEQGIKVIDPEFAFYGPMGYDIGNVIGNLFFSLVNCFYETPNTQFITYLYQQIQDIIDFTYENIMTMYDGKVNCELYKATYFKEAYVKEIIEDTYGYAGTEIIRRVVGDTKVMEITSIKLIETRVKVETTLIHIGKYLIMNRKNITSTNQLIQEVKQIMK